MSYERLMREHDEIEQLIADLLLLVGRPRGDAGDVSAALSTLGIAVDEHLSYERRQIYASVKAVPAPKFPIGARELATIDSVWSDLWQFLADWIGQIIEIDWGTFQQEAYLTLAKLTAHMRMEAERLYPFALQHGLVALHDRPATGYLGTQDQPMAALTCMSRAIRTEYQGVAESDPCGK